MRTPTIVWLPIWLVVLVIAPVAWGWLWLTDRFTARFKRYTETK